MCDLYGHVGYCAGTANLEWCPFNRRFAKVCRRMRWAAAVRVASMWGFRRRRQEAATEAIADIVHESILHIRAMAHTRTSMCDDFFPECDYEEQIRELADLCDNLVPGLRPDGRRRPLDALQFVWDSRSEQQRAWIRRCLGARGVLVEDLIATGPDRVRVPPA